MKATRRGARVRVLAVAVTVVAVAFELAPKTSRKQFNEADIEEMRQKLAEMEDMIQPPKNSPPQSPKPPSYAPPATDDSSSAIYWSGWNNTDSTTVKSEGERDDDNEDSNIDMYEKAYRANDTEGINPSNVVNDHSHKNVNEATATATAIETSTSMDNVENEERFAKIQLRLAQKLCRRIWEMLGAGEEGLMLGMLGGDQTSWWWYDSRYVS